MANNLPLEKQIAVVHALAEGNAIRAIERMTGIHRDTVMRLGVKAGENFSVKLRDISKDGKPRKNTVLLPCVQDLLAIGVDFDRADGLVSKEQVGKYPSSSACK